jgi:hypothetical protein
MFWFLDLEIVKKIEERAKQSRIPQQEQKLSLKPDITVIYQLHRFRKHALTKQKRS